MSNNIQRLQIKTFCLQYHLFISRQYRPKRSWVKNATQFLWKMSFLFFLKNISYCNFFCIQQLYIFLGYRGNFDTDMQCVITASGKVGYPSWRVSFPIIPPFLLNILPLLRLTFTLSSINMSVYLLNLNCESYTRFKALVAT